MVMDKDFVGSMVSVDVMDSWFHYGPVHRYAVKDKEKDKLRHTVHSLHVVYVILIYINVILYQSMNIRFGS